MNWLHAYIHNWNAWETVGWIGQLLFFGRFFLQWVMSEKHGRSVIPYHFWTMSIAGSALLLVYLVHAFVTTHTSMPIIVGQCTGILIYVRNLMLLRKEKAGDPA